MAIVNSGLLKLYDIEASRGAGAQRVTFKSTGCGRFRSSFEAKRGVEFRHSARNASRIRRKVDHGVSFNASPVG